MNTITKYDDLIRRLRDAGDGPEGVKMAHEAADAIEQLSAGLEHWMDNCSRCRWKDAVHKGCATCKHSYLNRKTEGICEYASDHTCDSNYSMWEIYEAEEGKE